jgi:hypothetical protein
MPTPANETQATNPMATRTDVGRTYNKSVQVGDPGGASEANPHPTRPFVNPNPDSRMLTPDWQKRSGA